MTWLRPTLYWLLSDVSDASVLKSWDFLKYQQHSQKYRKQKCRFTMPTFSFPCWVLRLLTDCKRQRTLSELWPGWSYTAATVTSACRPKHSFSLHQIVLCLLGNNHATYFCWRSESGVYDMLKCVVLKWATMVQKQKQLRLTMIGSVENLIILFLGGSSSSERPGSS